MENNEEELISLGTKETTEEAPNGLPQLSPEQKEAMQKVIAAASQEIDARATDIVSKLVIVESGRTTFIGLEKKKLRVGAFGELHDAFLSLMTEKGVRITNYPWESSGPVKVIEIQPTLIMRVRHQSESMQRDVSTNYVRLVSQLRGEIEDKLREMMVKEASPTIIAPTADEVAAVTGTVTPSAHTG